MFQISLITIFLFTKTVNLLGAEIYDVEDVISIKICPNLRSNILTIVTSQQCISKVLKDVPITSDYNIFIY